MTTTNLQFYAVGSYPYPFQTTGTRSAMTVCLYENEPVLGILTQTGYEDEFVCLSLNKSLSVERGRVTVAHPHEVIWGNTVTVSALRHGLMFRPTVPHDLSSLSPCLAG